MPFWSSSSFKKVIQLPSVPLQATIKQFESAGPKFPSPSRQNWMHPELLQSPLCGVERPSPGLSGVCVSRLHMVGSDSDKSHSYQCSRAREHVSQLIELFEPRVLQEHPFCIRNSQSDQSRYLFKFTHCICVFFFFNGLSSLWSFLLFLSSVLLHCVYSLLQNIPRVVFLHLTWKVNCTDVTLKTQTTKYLLKHSTLLDFFSWVMTGQAILFLFQRRRKKN